MGLGIRSIRLTGGEPLLRPDVVDVVAALADLGEPGERAEISLTTTALRLPELAGPLKDAGLRRINVSLDTLDRYRYQQLTRRDRLEQVLAGLEAARAVGLDPIKLNAVAMRGVNDAEVVDLVRFAVARGYQMRFIEQMPLDAGHTWDRTQMVSQDEILDALRAELTLTPLPGRGAAPAQTWLVDGGPGTVGVIASVSAPFCGSCDRLRLTADGQLRACLFAQSETDVRSVLRAGADDEAIAVALRACVVGKRPGHDIDDPGFLQPVRPMSAIGG